MIKTISIAIQLFGKLGQVTLDTLGEVRERTRIEVEKPFVNLSNFENKGN